MRVATNDTKVAQFHDIVAWEGVGEAAAKSLRKGAAVTVEGRLQAGRFVFRYAATFNGRAVAAYRITAA